MAEALDTAKKPRHRLLFWIPVAIAVAALGVLAYFGLRAWRTVTIGEESFRITDTQIVTGDFTQEDIEAFTRFRALARADVTACTDRDTVFALAEALPDTQVVWTVELAGQRYSQDTRELTLDGAAVSPGQLEEAVSWLPELESVTVTGTAYSPEEQLALSQDLPEISFDWEILLGGRSFRPEDTRLDFSGQALTAEDARQIPEALGLFQQVEEMDFRDCGLTDQELFQLCDACPGVRVLWETQLFGVPFSTMDSQLCFDDIPLTLADAKQIEAFVPYMPNLEKVTMLRCGISDEDMDALNKRHEDVNFVWMVQVRNCGVRTDATYFTVYNCEYYYDTDNLSGQALKYCPDMVAMDLGHLKVYAGTEFLASLPNLKYLILSNIAYGTVPELAYLKELIWLEIFWSSFYDLTPLLECTNLRHLNITYIRVPNAAAAEQDIWVLSQMTWLDRLWLSNNMFSEDQVQTLRDALPDTEIMVIYTLDCVSKGWRDVKEYFDMRDALNMYYMDENGNTIRENPYRQEETAEAE